MVNIPTLDKTALMVSEPTLDKTAFNGQRTYSGQN